MSELDLDIEILRDPKLPGYIIIKEEEWCKILIVLCRTAYVQFLREAGTKGCL